jgi:P-type Ca2+ transporter type 2C
MLATTGFETAPALTPVQLLWINLLSDVLPAVGLALEPPEPDTLRQPPRNAREPLLSPAQLRVLAREGAVIAAGALAAYGYGRLRYGPSTRVGTIAFSSLVGAQLLHALTCRSPALGLFSTRRMSPNRPLAITLAGSAALQIGILTISTLRRLIGLSPLDAFDAFVSLLGAVMPFLINEAAKISVRPAEPGPR